jgi:Holliday junction resolvase
MSRKSHDKGNRVERAIVAALIEHGFAAERVAPTRGLFVIELTVLALERAQG